jgi:hypothetical protein
MRRSDSVEEGFAFDVDRPAIARLRFEAAAGLRMLLRQDSCVVLLGRVDEDNAGMHVYRPGHFTPVLPALRTAAIEAVPGLGSTFSSHSRLRRFATQLQSGPGPLSAGSWILRPDTVPDYALLGDLVGHDGDAYLDWLKGWNGVVTLRPVPAADEGRVKAYRKLARAGILPPLLLWKVSPLDGWLLLDGHARLAAAQAEDVRPPVVVLSQRLGADERRRLIADAEIRFHAELLRCQDSITRGVPGAQERLGALARHFGSFCAEVDAETSRTRSWLLPGGSARWDATAQELAPGWSAGRR